MAAILDSIRNLGSEDSKIHFNPTQFIQENITRTWWTTVWVIALTAFTISYIVGQLQAGPITTIIILAVWLVTLSMMIWGELTKNHNTMTLWLKENLYNSITNTFVSLILLLLLVAAIRGIFAYAVINASFSTDPAVAREATAGTRGARWGAVIVNFQNLLVFRMKDEMIRIWATLIMLVVLAIPSFVVFRDAKYKRSRIRQILTGLWLLTPLLTFYFLRGFGSSGPFQAIDPDQVWGGLLLTIIISVFAIVVSFPMGLMLALGRRSTIQGIPAWITYGLTLIVGIWGLTTSTPDLLADARTTFGRILALWPLLLPIIAFLFQRFFKGNVVAAFSTIYIEVVRGVPLITVLFMSIILFPIFLPPDVDISATVRVLFAFAFFAAAYLAENVRGGLQALPNGQYEAADSLGLSTYKKYRLIILPQALRLVIPAIVGQFIGLFKDTSLVFLVGLFDFLNVANAISAQPDWLTIRTEPYIFLFVVYFLGSSLMSGYSRRLEKQLGVGER